MAQSYPLYDKLVARVTERKEKTIDIKRICTTITNISQTSPPEEAKRHYEELAALILHHDIINNGGIVLSPTPYDGKVLATGKGILNTMMNLPPNLQQIIAQYIEECSNVGVAASSELIHC